MLLRSKVLHDHKTIPGLEWLRILAIFLILLLHAKPVAPCKTSTAPIFFFYGITAFYDFVASLGVPVFMLISVVLLEMKLQHNEAYFGGRLKRLLDIFVFWTAVQFVAWGMTSYLGMQNVYSPSFSSFPGIIFRGGPPLPIVGGSVFYFISDLIVISVLHYCVRRYLLSARGRISGIVLSFLVFAFGTWFRQVSFSDNKFPFFFGVLGLDEFSPLNFLIYCPIAVWLVGNGLNSTLGSATVDHGLRIPILLSFYFAFLSLEVYMRLKTNIPFTVYGRPSLPIGAWILVEIAFRIKKIPSFLSRMSKLVLGVFAIHKYWILGLTFLIPSIPIESRHFFGGCDLDVARLIRLLLVCLGSFISTGLLASNGMFRPFLSTSRRR